MKREKGTILITTAVSLLALVTVMGLALDLGVMYTARTSAQHAADAGALAGAYMFINYPPGTVNNGGAYPNGNQSVAKLVAQNTVAKNKILGQSFATSDATVTFPTSTRITVDVAKAVPTYFMKVAGWNTVTVRAHATAEASNAPTGTTCLRPFWITLKALNGGTCGGSSPHPGDSIQLWDKDTGGLIGASDWGLIGHNDPAVADAISTCSAVLNSCGDTLENKPGHTVGKLVPAMEDVICPDEGGNCKSCGGVDCGDWIWKGPGEYTDRNTNVNSNMVPAVMTVAVWDDCSGPSPKGGRTNFSVAGYIELFVENVDKKNGIGTRFIKMDECPGNTSGSNISGPQAIPIRLINPN